MMTGMISEIVSYGFMLICGYLLSHLLEIAMAGQWEKIGSTAVWTVAVLTVSAVPKYGLGVHKSCVKHIDTEDFREYPSGDNAQIECQLRSRCLCQWPMCLPWLCSHFECNR